MKRIAKLSLASVALAVCMVAAPMATTSAVAAPAATTIDMMRAIEGSAASPVEQVHRRHWHRRHCRLVRKCWRSHWGHRRCRWVRRCW